MSVSNIMYDVPQEPTSVDSSFVSLAAQVVDLRDDMDELTDTVHHQWVQFCDDNEDIELRLIAKYKKLFILLVMNMGVSGVLLCAIIAILLM